MNLARSVVSDGGASRRVRLHGRARPPDDRWRIVETRNGSNESTRQWVWGSEYVDEPLFMDVNGNPGAGDNMDCDPDVAAQIQFGVVPARALSPGATETE
jgi:hypothetical protein